VQFFDRFLYSSKSIDEEQLQELALLCAIIASKMEEYSTYTLQSMLEHSASEMSLGAFKQLEWDIIRELDFSLGLPTSFSFLTLYGRMAAFECPKELSVVTAWPVQQMPTLIPASLVERSLRREVLDCATEWLDLFLHLNESLDWLPSVSAAASLYLAIKDHNLLSDDQLLPLFVDQLQCDQPALQACITLLDAKVRAMKETASVVLAEQRPPLVTATIDYQRKIQYYISEKVLEIFPEHIQPEYNLNIENIT
jgi:hypothetical protein